MIDPCLLCCLCFAVTFCHDKALRHGLNNLFPIWSFGVYVCWTWGLCSARSIAGEAMSLDSPLSWDRRYKLKVATIPSPPRAWRCYRWLLGIWSEQTDVNNTIILRALMRADDLKLHSSPNSFTVHTARVWTPICWAPIPQQSRDSSTGRGKEE